MAQVSFSYSTLRDWAPLTTESMVPGKLYGGVEGQFHWLTVGHCVGYHPLKGQVVGGFAHVVVAVRLDSGSFVVADESPVYRVTELAKVTLISED